MSTYNFDATLEKVKKLSFRQATFTTAAVFADLVDPEADFVDEKEKRYLARVATERYLAWLDGDFEKATRLQIEGEDWLTAKLDASNPDKDDTTRH